MNDQERDKVFNLLYHRKREIELGRKNNEDLNELNKIIKEINSFYMKGNLTYNMLLHRKREIETGINCPNFLTQDELNKINNNLIKIKEDIQNFNTEKTIKKEETSEIVIEIKKNKKEKIPTSVKNTVWSLNFPNVIQGNCYCCKLEVISRNNFDCGHIVSEKNGGKVKLDNLKPICRSCNSTMGTMNMNEFMKKYGFDKIKIESV